MPVLLQFAHRLLPRRACSIFDDCEQKTLESLNEAIKTEPWILGYWTVLTERFGLSGCEAKLSSFEYCNLLQKMPVVMRDALRIYHSLREMTRKFGHTYVYLQQLKGKLRVTNWEGSLSYLSSIDAVKTSEDHLGNKRHVFLPYLRRCEQGIACNLSKIISKTPWTGNIEIEEQVNNMLGNNFFFSKDISVAIKLCKKNKPGQLKLASCCTCIFKLRGIRVMLTVLLLVTSIAVV